MSHIIPIVAPETTPEETWNEQNVPDKAQSTPYLWNAPPPLLRVINGFLKRATLKREATQAVIEDHEEEDITFKGMVFCSFFIINFLLPFSAIAGIWRGRNFLRNIGAWGMDAFNFGQIVLGFIMVYQICAIVLWSDVIFKEVYWSALLFSLLLHGLRLGFVALKYAYRSDDLLERTYKTRLHEDEKRDEEIISGWYLVKPSVARVQYQHTRKRVVNDDFSNKFFIFRDRAVAERLMNVYEIACGYAPEIETIHEESDGKSLVYRVPVACFVYDVVLVEYLQASKKHTHSTWLMVVELLKLVLSAGFAVIPMFVRIGYGIPPLGSSIQAMLSIIGAMAMTWFVAHLFLLPFLWVAIGEYSRRLRWLKTIGKAEHIDFRFQDNLNAWVECRLILAEFGRKYSIRSRVMFAVLLGTELILLLFLILNSFAGFIPPSTPESACFLIIVGSWTLLIALALFNAVTAASRINRVSDEHCRLLNSVKLRILFDQSSAANTILMLSEKVSSVIEEIRLYSLLSPISLIGMRVDDSFMVKLFGLVISVVALIIQRLLL